MLTAVVHQGNRFPGQFLSVEGELICAGRISGEPADRYMINGLPVAVVDFAGRPTFRQTGSQTQLISREVHAQQSFDEQPIHPTSRASIPSPSATARVRRDRIDVRSDDIRLNFVGGDLFGSPTVM